MAKKGTFSEQMGNNREQLGRKRDEIGTKRNQMGGLARSKPHWWLKNAVFNQNGTYRGKRNRPARVRQSVWNAQQCR
jgi:hypothetical protein